MQYYTASRAISAHGLMQLRGRSISTLGLHLPLATRPAPAAATATNNGSINSLRRTTTSGIILPCARRRTTRRPFSSSSSKIAAQYNRFGGRSGGGGGGGGSLFETLLSRARTYHFVIIGALIGATYTYNSDTVEVCIIHKKSSTFLFLSSHYYMYMLASSWTDSYYYIYQYIVYGPSTLQLRLTRDRTPIGRRAIPTDPPSRTRAHSSPNPSIDGHGESGLAPVDSTGAPYYSGGGLEGSRYPGWWAAECVCFAGVCILPPCAACPLDFLSLNSVLQWQGLCLYRDPTHLQRRKWSGYSLVPWGGSCGSPSRGGESEYRHGQTWVDLRRGIPVQHLPLFSRDRLEFGV